MQRRDLEIYRHLYLTGRLSRRAFLRKLAALGGAAALAPWISACVTTQPAVDAGAPAKEQGAAQPQVEQAEMAAGEPKYGGVYRILGAGDFRTLDPPGAESSEDWWSAGMVLYNCLYFYDKDGKFFADLAADMPVISDDGLVYTIPIRQGVKFHNGRELVAEDVKFTLERQLWPEVYSWGKTYMDNVIGYDDVIAGTSQELSGIKVIDDYTVEISLKQAQAVFPALLTMSMNAIIPKAETLEAGADWGSKIVIGTGPFRFVEWVAGEKAVYERNPDYFREGLPYLDGIELFLNVDPAVQMLRWESGEAELVHNVPDAERPRLLSDPELKKLLRTAPGVGTVRLAFHFKTPPFDDIRVRQAIAMAIDKEGMARKASGTITPLEGHFALPMLQFDPNFKSNYQYDPEKAKQLLVEAGYADGIKGVSMYISGAGEERGQQIQADLQAIGIETELKTGQWKEYRDRIRAGEVALFIYGWAASFPDAFDFTSAWTTCKSAETGYNDGFYCNERIDELVEKAEGLPLQDPERVAAYREIEDIVINQDVAWVGLYNPQQLILGVDYVHDDFVSGIYGWPYLETAWMDREA
jgi:peptide/nickel transport system substrate-binding protein